ncbi:MAG: UDP-3-O-acyl-N-acetylglucosamine deacetylase [Myxococcales bacterium]|nr:UDP-3-O-acyl-N-acetylglucosamine deacetylase [Myxococcales bacterium]
MTELSSTALTGAEHTLASRVGCTGIGLHSGKPVELTLRPAAAGTGILFERTDLASRIRFPARSEWVVDTLLATTLGTRDAQLSTVEHLLAALRSLGVDNCTVEVAGPELPVMDGSAAPFVYLIQEAGLLPQRRMRRRLVIRRPIEIRDRDRYVRIVPSREFKVTIEIEYSHPAIGRSQLESVRIRPEQFVREIAPARTFGFLKEVQGLQSLGRALGGSLQNAVVLDDRGVLNREGLRFPDEFVRHKLLDLIGDLALLGLPIQGHVKASKTGHALNQALVAEIRANPRCWTVESHSPETEAPGRRFALPGLRPAFAGRRSA